MLLCRIAPHVDRGLDPCQEGFRWGADEQVYALVEILTVRGNATTYCASLDIRKAYDVAWRDSYA